MYFILHAFPYILFFFHCTNRYGLPTMCGHFDSTDSVPAVIFWQEDTNRKFEHYIRVLNVALEHEVGDQGEMIFEMNLKEWLGDKNVASGEHWGPCKGMED